MDKKAYQVREKVIPFRELKIKKRDEKCRIVPQHDLLSVDVLHKNNKIASMSARIYPEDKIIRFSISPSLFVKEEYRQQHIGEFTVLHLLDHIGKYMEDNKFDPNEWVLHGFTFRPEVRRIANLLEHSIFKESSDHTTFSSDDVKSMIEKARHLIQKDYELLEKRRKQALEKRREYETGVPA